MDDLPMTRDDARRLADKLKTAFGERMRDALAGTHFSVEIACAIACKETGLYLLPFLKRMSMDEALARCVFDASGDAAGTSRGAFPKNTAAFRERYGDALTDMLIAEANLTRNARGMKDAPWVYKGYGLFQYDLQNIVDDEAFFRDRLWCSFDECLDRLVQELQDKYRLKKDVHAAIQAYNGSGSKAVVYVSQVEQLAEFIA
jgi:hypothetical protein